MPSASEILEAFEGFLDGLPLAKRTDFLNCFRAYLTMRAEFGQPSAGYGLPSNLDLEDYRREKLRPQRQVLLTMLDELLRASEAAEVTSASRR